MKKIRLTAWYVLFSLTFGATHTIAAQTPPQVNIDFPIHGHLAYQEPYSNYLTVIDTFTGISQVVAKDQRLIVAPLWDWQGRQLAYGSYEYNLSIWDSGTGKTRHLTDIVQDDNNDPLVFYPLGWSKDGSQIFYEDFNRLQKSSGEFRDRYNLSIVDLKANSVKSIMTFWEGDSVDPLLITPRASSCGSVTFTELNHALWNPVYADWIALDAVGYVPLPFPSSGVEETSNKCTLPRAQDNIGLLDEAYVPIDVLYNIQTGKVFFLDSLLVNTVPNQLNADIGELMGWDQDGIYLLAETTLHSDKAVQVFDLQYINSNWLILQNESARSPQFIQGWSHINDWFVTAYPSHNGNIFSLAELKDKHWQFVELLELPQPLLYTNYYAWGLTPTDDERRRLVCLFESKQECA